MNLLRGHVLVKLGNDVNTDEITSSKYVTSTKPEELAKICMRDLDPEFPQKIAPGGFLVAGKNFGCGSSREWAPTALKAAGVRAIIAEEFARIFYRNALNISLPVIECKGAVAAIDLGDELEIDLSRGLIKNITKGITLESIPIPSFILERIKAGGLVAFLREQLKGK